MAPKGMRSFERNHYFYGKLMTARDFKAEQEYHREKQWLHTRLAHDWGVVGGLRVESAEEAGNPWLMVLKKGLAVDSQGREILVAQDHAFDLSKLMYQCGLKPSEIRKPVYLTLSYSESEAEPVPVYAREGATDDGAAPNRVVEGYTLAVTDKLPATGASFVREIMDLVETALKPMDIGNGYKPLGGVGIPPSGAVRVAAAADSEDLLVGTGNATLGWVNASDLSIEDVATTQGNAVGIATAPGVAWIATASTVRMARWLAGSSPVLTQSWSDQSITEVAAHPFDVDGKFIAYYVAKIPDLYKPELAYWRLARITSDGSFVELQPQLEHQVRGLAVSPDGTTLFFAMKEEARWHLFAYDLQTSTVTLQVADLGGPPVSLQTGEENGKTTVFVVTAHRYWYFTVGAPEPKVKDMPAEFTVTAAALQGPRALLVGMDSLTSEPVLQVYDLTENRRITYRVLRGVPRSVTVLPAPSYRVYVGTNLGVEVFDVPVQTSDLYQLLANRSLDLPVTAPEARALVLAAVPLRNGLPDSPNIDNISYRRVLVSSADLLSVIGGLTAAVARGGGGGGQVPSGIFSPTPEVVGSKVENRKYTVRVRAVLKDAEGRPAPAGVSVSWSISSELGLGSAAMVHDMSLTDPSGVAFATATGLTAEQVYSITAMVGGRGDTVRFTGDPVQASYEVTVEAQNLRRETNGTFTANLVATVRENDGPAPQGLDVIWQVNSTEAALDITMPTKTVTGGTSSNTIRNMKLSTGYVVTATVQGQAGQVTVSIPAALPHTVELEAGGYSIQSNGRLSLPVTARVLDSWGFPIPGAPDVTWTGTPAFQRSTTPVNEWGESTATALDLEVDKPYQITARCGLAEAQINVTPRAFTVTVTATQQSDGQYSYAFVAEVKNGAGGSAPANQPVTWSVRGAGKLAPGESSTDGVGKAYKTLSDVPLGQGAVVTALAQYGIGQLEVKPSIAKLTFEAANYAIRNNEVARQLTVKVENNYGELIKAQLPVTWTVNQTAAMAAPSTNLDGTGSSKNWVGSLVRDTDYTITATCGGISAQYRMRPQDYRVDFRAEVQPTGLYQVGLTAWAENDKGELAGAKSPTTWVLTGAGTLFFSHPESDGNSASSAVVTGLGLDQTAKLTVLGNQGWGYQEVQPQIKSVTVTSKPYTVRNGVVTRELTATVLDVWNQPYPTGTMVWRVNTGPDQQFPISGGVSTFYLSSPQNGQTYTVKASYGGREGSVTMTPATYTVTRTSASVNSAGEYTAGVRARVFNEGQTDLPLPQQVSWYILNGGQVTPGKESSTTDGSYLAPSEVSGLQLNMTYRVVAAGPQGFGVLELAPVIQSVSVALGDLSRQGSALERPVTATVTDSFGLARKGASVQFSMAPALGVATGHAGTVTTGDGGVATTRFTGFATGTAYTVTATCAGKSATHARTATEYNLARLETLNQENGTYKLGVYGIVATGTTWSIDGPSGTSGHSIPATHTTNASGMAVNTASGLQLRKGSYTIHVIGPDGYGKFTHAREPKYLSVGCALDYNAGTGMWRWTAQVKDADSVAMAGYSFTWSGFGSPAANTSNWEGLATRHIYLAPGAAHQYTGVTADGYTPGSGELYWGWGSTTASATVQISKSVSGGPIGGGGGSSSLVAEPTADQVEELGDGTLGLPQYKRDQLDEMQMSFATTEFARLSAVPESLVVQATHQVSLRSAGALREESDRYALKVVAAVKGAEGEPLAGMAVAWEGVPAEQIEVLAAETDQYGTAAALVHGLSPDEVYGITAVVGEVRDTLFADKSTSPDYYLTLEPLPVDESGEAGFTIDLRDADQAPVKGATVRYTINGGEETTAGKLVTSRAREPKPLVVKGLKAGTRYQIEVSGKDVIAILHYIP